MMSLQKIVFMSMILAVLANDKETYTDKYDNVDLAEIVTNRRLLIAYANCLLEKGKCSPEGNTLKDHMIDAVETGCEKCTKAQKNGTQFIIEHLLKYEPAIWQELCEKYDPEGKWRKVYEDRARANGIIA